MVPEFHAPMQVRLGFSRTRRDFMGEQEEVYEVGPRHSISLFLNDARPFPCTRCAVTSHARLETAAGVSCALSAQPAGAPPGPPAYTDLAPCDHVLACASQSATRARRRRRLAATRAPVCLRDSECTRRAPERGFAAGCQAAWPVCGFALTPSYVPSPLPHPARPAGDWL